MQALLLTFAMLVAASGAKTDAQIESDIKARLARSKIAADGFQVKVRNGTATWTGKTDVIQHKGSATRMAKSAGATAVDNRIDIGASARAKASAALRRTRPVQTRTEPRSQAPRTETEPVAPPPVRRAVVKVEK